MNHVSFDLETLGKSPDAMIVQIGWAQFDIETGEVGQARNVLVSPNCGKIDMSTVSWWLQQDDAARAGMVAAIDTGVPLAVALASVRSEMPNDAIVWGNGATFDITILESAFARCMHTVPWAFFNVRDMRTIVHAAEALRGFDKRSVERIGVHHDAADDAAHQARVICAAWKSLRSA